MRTAFIDQLVKEAEKNEKIFLIVGDLGYNVVNVFENRFPDRFLNAGIAEQNMIGVACGLAMQNYIVYVYSIGNFPTLRCLEQIRNDVAYNNLNIRIVSVGAGFAYGSLGASHHATEDIGVMRTLPNMTVCSPGDPIEAKKITEMSVSHSGPMYLRLGKAGEQIVHEDQFSEICRVKELKIGDIIPVLEERTTTRKAVFATGSILKDIKDEIIQNNLDYDLYSFPFIKPINELQLAKIVNQYSEIICIEEHQLDAGFSSAIIEKINDLFVTGKINTFPKIIRKGINNTFIYVSGSQKYLRQNTGLKVL